MSRLIGLLLLFLIVCGNANSQEQTTEEKLNRLEMAERGIFKLPHDFDYIHDSIIPELHARRAQLAPDYPLRENLIRDEAIVHDAFIAWIDLHEDQYYDYIKYLENYIRVNKNH